MSEEKLVNPEYIEEMEYALDQVKLQLTLDLLKGMIKRDHFLLMNWQLFKYHIEETSNSTTFSFMGPFGKMGTVTVTFDNNQYNCYLDTGNEIVSSEFHNTLDEVISFIFFTVEDAGKKQAA